MALFGLGGSLTEMGEQSQFSDKTTVRRHRPDYQIVLFMGLLMMFGLIIMYAIGPQRANVLNNAYGSNYSGTYFFFKQLISLSLALVAFLTASLVPYTVITKHAKTLMYIGLGSCVLLAVASVLHLGIAQQSLGATRWFNLGPLGSLQPAELLKFSMLIFLAGFLGSKARQGKINDVKSTLIPLAILMSATLFFIIIVQKDFGTGASIVGMVAAMLTVSGLSKRYGMIAFLAAFAVAGMLIVIAPHRVERVLTFLEGDKISSSSDDSSYQITQAKLAIGSGGLFGVGIGNSVQATGYLPEATNDSVFAIVGETFGFVGSVTVLAIFAGMLIRLLKIMDHLPDYRLKLMAAGVFGWLASHVILNVASMIGIFPLTGITLPLLSFGGTSMVFITAALGLIFQLSRYTVHSSNLKEGSYYENSSSRRGVGRPRYANRRSYPRG